MDCEEKRHYLAVCVFKQKEVMKHNPCFSKLHSVLLQKCSQTCLFLQKLKKAADVNIRQYKRMNIYNYAPEKSQEEGSFYKYCCKGYRVAQAYSKGSIRATKQPLQFP